MNSCLSFDIGVRNLHAVLGQAEGTNVKIMKSIVKPLPKGVITEGLVSNMELLSQAMQETIAEVGAHVKDAVITFNSNSVIIREFEVPYGTDQEVEAMIKNEITQYFGMTDTDLVEYRKIGQTDADNEKKIHVRAAVMNTELARGYYDLLLSLNLKPVALDIHPNVISKVCSGQTTVNGISADAYILLDIGYSGTMVYIITKGSLNFFRFVNFGGKAIDRVLTNALFLTEKQAEAKKLELLSDYIPVTESVPETTEKSTNRALLIKKKGYRFTSKKNDIQEELSLPEEELAVSEVEPSIELQLATASDKTVTKEEILAAVKPVYGELLEDLRKVIQFFVSRSGAQKIDQIYLMGEGAHLTGLADYLSQGIGTNVSRLQSISAIHFTNNEKQPGSFINAAGALIRL